MAEEGIPRFPGPGLQEVDSREAFALECPRERPSREALAWRVGDTELEKKIGEKIGKKIEEALARGPRERPSRAGLAGALGRPPPPGKISAPRPAPPSAPGLAGW